MRTTFSAFLQKRGRADLLLMLCSFCIYFIYFHRVFLNINSILSGITLDTLKNYYTYAYHIKNDSGFLNFTGMNYPFGEHVVYTDCQPILTFILRLLPFTHHWLIGILHTLIFVSFIITPVILFRILRRLKMENIASFFLALGVSILSPQFLKINAGHHTLTYAFIIPLSLLLQLRYFNENTKKNFCLLFFYNTLLFPLHPYLGFSVCVFTIISLITYFLMDFDRKLFISQILNSMFIGVVPLFIFKVFMMLTDHHKNRPSEPIGINFMVENIDSMVAPVFGPFKRFFETVFNDRPPHFEGHSYLGFSVIVLTALFILLMPFVRKKLVFKKEITAPFISAFFLLLFSFGLHFDLMALFGTESETLNQLRAVCRFAWFFYYVLPVFLITVLYNSFGESEYFKNKMTFVCMLIFALNVFEAHYMFRLDKEAFWCYRNVFNSDCLNAEEKRNLELIAAKKPQAIIPLPIFHGGNEVYDRLGFNNSMLPSMIYSYHAGLPILSVSMSRTSIDETERLIETLNQYKKKKEIEQIFTGAPFFVLKTNDALLPDEERLLKKTKLVEGNDSLTPGFISRSDLFSVPADTGIVVLKAVDTNVQLRDLIFLRAEDRKPFTISKISDYETITVVDTGKIETGNYVVSFRYYYSKKNYRAVAINLIVTRGNMGKYEWEYNIPVRIFSGFYPGYAVFEHKIKLDKTSRYEFILKGESEHDYRMSHFLLRPHDKTVVYLQAGDSIINNFAPR